MRGLAAAGRIRPTDPVWRAGTRERVLAARVKNLFAAPPPAAQPAGTPATHRAAAPPEPAQALPAATTALDHPAPGRLVLDVARRGPEPAARQKRVVGIKGAILMGQDGVKVQFRKKCGTCGYEEGCRSSAVIRVGPSRVPFFCPKCRRARTVEFTGVG
jgi:hypothetical protein